MPSLDDAKARLAVSIAEEHRAAGVSDIDELARRVVGDLLRDDLIAVYEVQDWTSKVAADLRRAG